MYISLYTIVGVLSSVLFYNSTLTEQLLLDKKKKHKGKKIYIIKQKKINIIADKNGALCAYGTLILFILFYLSIGGDNFLQLLHTRLRSFDEVPWF